MIKHDHHEEHDQLIKKNTTTTPSQSHKIVENINVQAAYIHAMGDLLQSVGVGIAGAIIWYNPSWQIADPIATFMFAALVIATTLSVLKSSLHVLMQGTLEGIDPYDIEVGMRALSYVIDTHDMHIWSITVGVPSLSVHVVSNDPDEALSEVQEYLLSKGIQHSTIQIENESIEYPISCKDADDDEDAAEGGSKYGAV